MPKNLPALHEGFFRFFLVLLMAGTLLYGQQAAGEQAEDITVERTEAKQDEPRQRIVMPPGSRWYRSNASGMPLESIPSAAAALRNEYALAVSPISSNEVPPLLLAYYVSSYSVEQRTLFENWEILRQQWIFRDARGTTRVNASGTSGFFYENGFETGKGFIEFYNPSHTLTEELLFSAGSESRTLFTYSREGLLVKAETWIKTPSPEPVAEAGSGAESDAETEGMESGGAENREPTGTESPENAEPQNSEDSSPEPAGIETRESAPAEPSKSGPDITDLYRYSRSASLRAIERIYHSGYSEDSRNRVPFPAISPAGSREPQFVNPGVAHSSEFLDDVVIPPEGKVVYSTDSRGRVLSEERLDEKGEVLGELKNNWSGDRLSSVSWKSGEDEWLIEYEYDSRGNRIMERNFNRGVLERTVRAEGNREVEELYMNGKIVLRAIFEEGRKISEERVRQN